ncbi:MAG: hypothetical protein LBB26_02945 [Puniceicoccales bacterium]|jgi:hypothetical protein|nr:hypothetical protein [Puniceicoccales bacterium]
MEIMDEGVDDIVRKVADSWDSEAEKISEEGYAGDPDARKAYMILKVFARLAREGKIQESFTQAMNQVSDLTLEELGSVVEKFQKEHDIDFANEFEKIVAFMTAGLRAQKPAGTTADDLIRSMFVGK